VLSACQTGLGEARAGEGVFGLRRAFQVAGARTLVTSLWSVGDAPTRLFMEELHRARLLHHAAWPEAVRRASLAVLRRGGSDHHPFAWAAFVAAGDWR
jgi:CHAT domain-containing protein